MKKHLLTGIIAIMITLVFVGSLYIMIRLEGNLVLVGILLGVAWIISLALLFSTVYSRKRQGYICLNKHSK